MLIQESVDCKEKVPYIVGNKVVLKLTVTLQCIIRVVKQK